MLSTRDIHIPSLAILLSTVIWGTWWIPLRQLDQLAGGTVWLVAAGIWVPALLFLPKFIATGGRILRRNRATLYCAIFFGLTTTLYAEGALRGNVARVILLFYLTTVWSTLLARAMLNEPVTPARLVSIALGLTGMWIVLGGDNSGFIPMPNSVAEWMGLTAGLCWALAMVYARKIGQIPVTEMAFPIFTCFALSMMLVTLIPGGRSWDLSIDATATAAIVWVLLIGLLWHIPAIVLTLFGANDVEPGRISILLMMEVVIGVGSATLFANEVFGIRELLGSVFILSASVAEFAPALLRRPHTP